MIDPFIVIKKIDTVLAGIEGIHESATARGPYTDSYMAGVRIMAACVKQMLQSEIDTYCDLKQEEMQADAELDASAEEK